MGTLTRGIYLPLQWLIHCGQSIACLCGTCYGAPDGWLAFRSRRPGSLWAPAGTKFLAEPALGNSVLDPSCRSRVRRTVHEPGTHPCGHHPRSLAGTDEIYRRMSPLKRLELAFRMSNSLRQVVIDGVRSRHPEFNKQQMQRTVLYLMQGKEIFARCIRESRWRYESGKLLGRSLECRCWTTSTRL